jgi:hypothetical protein
MGDGWFGLCDADYSAGGCCDREDCSIESGCNNCNGKLNDGKCELYSKFYDECCYEDGTDCSIMDDCESCDGVRRYPDWIADRNCWKSYPASEYIYWPCFSSKEDCEEDCGGLWTSKFDLARDANIDFINTVFDNNGDHKIGLVGYEGGPILDDGDSSTEDCSDCHDLVDSSGKNNLINFINAEWNPLSGSTCICCGFEKAIEYLEDSERFKSVILMTDGLPGSMTCEGLSDRDALKTFTERSFEEDGIRVYTIGFGDDVDDSLLQEVADLGGGEYFSSEASSELTDIYDRAITEIIRNYRAENNWDHLKIVFYNSTTSWIYRHYDVPLPLETIKYEIPSLGGLKESITNLTYVEAYMASYTESGVEVLSPLLGRAKF